jgi:hypothetical protein
MARKTTIKLEKLLPTKTATYDPAKQVAGLKKRLGASALPSAKVDDGRNPVERALNLRPDQNVFFDIIEVLDRPRNAIATAAVAEQKGEDFGQGLIKGITGEKSTSWKEYLVNTGLEDREGKVDFVDVAGIVMDMFVDPMNIPLWAISPFTGAAKKTVIEAIENTGKISAKLKAVDAATDLTKVAGFKNDAQQLLKQADTIKTIVKNRYGQGMSRALELAADAVNINEFNNAMSAFANIATAKKTVSTMGLVGRGVSASISGTIKFADNSITNILTKLDDINLKTNGEFAEDIAKYTREITSLDRYKTFKGFIQGVFDSSSQLGSRLTGRIKTTLGKAGFFDSEAKVFTKMNDELVAAFAKATGRSLEDSATTLMKLSEFTNYQGVSSIGELIGNTDTMVKTGMSVDELGKVKASLGRLKDFKSGKKLYTKETIEAMFNQITLDNGVQRYFFKSQNVDDVAKNYKAYRKAVEEAATGEVTKGTFNTLLESLNKEFDTSFNLSKVYSPEEIVELNKLLKDPTVTSYLTQLDEIGNSMYRTTDARLGTETVKFMKDKGVVPHRATPAAKKLFEQLDDFAFFDRKLKGNVKVGADRIYKFSAYESNLIFKASARNVLESGVAKGKYKAFFEKAANTQLFTEYINTAFADWLTNVPKTFLQARILNDIAVVGTFSDKDLVSSAQMTRLPNGGFAAVPIPGKVTYSKQGLIDKLDKMAKYQNYKLPFEDAKKIIKKLKGDTIYVDANLFDLIGINDASSSSSKIFLDYIDAANNWFKKLKLMSPGFHMRNFVGNFFNMIVGGVDPTKTLTYQSDVFKIMTNGGDLIEKTVRAGVNLATDDASLLKVLTSDELRLYKILKSYSFANLPKAGRMLWDLPEDVTKLLNANADDVKKLNILDKAFRYNAKANEWVDTYFRLQTFMYASENPEALARLGLVNPEDLVRRIHFDPNDLSVMEKTVLKRIIPFYTFTKKNLAFQLRNVTDNPRIYKQVATLFDGVWKARDIDPYTELEDFKREQFWLPVFKQDNGKYYALKLNVPIGDLSEFLNNPLQRAMSMFTPMLRAPFEMATNTQIFSGRPIQEFPGQKAYNLEFLNLINKVPGLEMFPARTAEYLLGQTGIDVPASLIGGTIGGIADLVGGEANFGEVAARGLLQSAVNVGEKEKGIRSRQYKELQRLQGLVKYAKQENIPIPTMAEIENKRSPLNNLIKKIRIRGLAK